LRLQKTIASEVKASGKGLFSGIDAKLVFKPAPEDTGVVFVRSDLDESVRIPALITSLVEKKRRTALYKGDASVETTEHCLAAVRALEIDNLFIELTGPEVPGFDGSANEFYKLLTKAGVVEQTKVIKPFVITDPIHVSDGESTLYALPATTDTLEVTFDMDYTQHIGIGRQLYTATLSTENFERNLAPARTFLLEAEAMQFQAMGIGTHLSPKEILVINSDGPIKNSFRFPDECVRHKIVDLIGDLSLAGMPIVGRIVAYKSGHSLNQKLAKKIMAAAKKKQRFEKTGTDALLDIKRIQRILPHRYPFLLVDKVIEIEGDSKITGIKNVTFNELFFQGHFPQNPIMPGVLIVEALAQISGLLFSQKLENTGRLAVLLTMDGVKIRKSVVPGDQLILQSESVKVRSRSAQCHAQAFVGDSIVAEADLKFMLIDDEEM